MAPPITHHTSHTMGNGASSSNSGSNSSKPDKDHSRVVGYWQRNNTKSPTFCIFCIVCTFGSVNLIILIICWGYQSDNTAPVIATVRATVTAYSVVTAEQPTVARNKEHQPNQTTYEPQNYRRLTTESLSRKAYQLINLPILFSYSTRLSLSSSRPVCPLSY